MTEFGYVRELNEGVKKIFSDMEEAGLPEPTYRDSANSVRLVLKNNAENKTLAPNKSINESINESLNVDEETILGLIVAKPEISQREMCEKTGFSRSKIQRILNSLKDKKIVSREGPRKKGTWKS